MESPSLQLLLLLLLLLLNKSALGSASGSGNGSSSSGNGSGSGGGPLSEEVLRSVSAYVRHKLSWRPEDYPSRAAVYHHFKQCHPRESERFTNATVRQQRESIHARFLVIERAINRCARPHYFPRTLSANQISWKSRPRPAQNASATTNDTAGASAQPAANATHVPGSNGTVAAPPPLDRNASNSSEVIHKYLVFALLLPQHPFSSDLAEALRVVAPMFPDITIVIGSAYEFRDFCSQYNVKSYPKLLFFHTGLLKHKYKQRHNPWELAQQFARWTNSLPVVAPDPGSPYRWIVAPQDGGLLGRMGIHLESYVNRSASYLPRLSSLLSPPPSAPSSFSSSALLRLAEHFSSTMTTRSFEPFAGTSDRFVGREAAISVAAGLFVAARGVFRVYSWTQRRRD